eukprot:TRINITY_DN8953_c0_g1_i1.p1 TRINITY_DN8953_c0_g1~~TRINITY_DN8953_c0_g1_i1.p1  ORF type:complete len:242 (+),score=97.30 TRINITY_DN8953_c0_g1_i1:87-728(+)
MEAWDEGAVEMLVTLSIAQALISLPVDRETDVGCLRELIVAEVLDWDPAAPEAPSAERVAECMGRSGVSDMLAGLDIEDDETAELYAKLSSGVAELMKGDEDDEEDLQDGQCELCERELPLTRHHVIPKTTHDYYLSGAGRKVGLTKEMCMHTIPVCRPCHNAIHGVRNHRELAEDHRDRDTLLAIPELSKFVAWVRKQKVKERPHAHRNHYR